jgi:hypothetical protein
MSRKTRKLTDEKLEALGAATTRLVALFELDLADLKDDFRALAANLQTLRDVTAPGLGTGYGLEGMGEDTEELDLDAILADLRRREELPENTDERPDESYDQDLLDVPNDGEAAVAWSITDSGERSYAAGGVSAYDTVESLLLTALRDGQDDPSFLNLHVGFVGPNPEDQYTFDGLLTVGV